LHKIRTSPDHGTAYEIAGKGIADFNSFKEAVYLAIDVSSLEINMPKSKPLRIKKNSCEQKKVNKIIRFAIIYLTPEV
jgi:4-hydroxythreonine-4-phosphate dehydrogenase